MTVLATESATDAARAAVATGLAGGGAMAIQVSTLMWLRTTINHQYRHGLPMLAAMRALHAQGGIRRFYAGYPAAIIQAPLSRMADTASNAGTLALLASSPATAALPIPVQTAAASTVAAACRILLMPIDTVKTTMQVSGSTAGLAILRQKMATAGPGVLFHGALGASAATFAGHFPWFAVYNWANARWPELPAATRPQKLVRAAAIGFAASMVSDSVSNSLRVIKTVRQTAPVPISYTQAVRDIVATDGVASLFGRGLKTKILTNGVQGLMFSVLWRLGQDYTKSVGK